MFSLPWDTRYRAESCTERHSTLDPNVGTDPMAKSFVESEVANLALLLKKKNIIHCKYFS